MTYRKLRIGWSAFWGLGAVLLCVLWVRSYWIADSFQYAGLRSTVINLNPGVVDFSRADVDPRLLGANVYRWRHFSRSNPERPAEHFQMLWIDTAFAIRFPISLSIAAVAGAALLPWIRFSLRTLLIATTLVAAVLGLIVYAIRN